MPAPAQPAVQDETPQECNICKHIVPKFSFKTSPGVEGEFCENCIHTCYVARGFVNDERQRDYIERTFLKAFNGYITAPATFYYDRRLTNPTAMGFVYSPNREQWIIKNQTVPDRFTGQPLLFNATVEHYLGGAISEVDSVELYNGQFAHAYLDDFCELSDYSEHSYKHAIFGRGPGQAFPLRMPNGKRKFLLNEEGPDVAEVIRAEMLIQKSGPVTVTIGSDSPAFHNYFGIPRHVVRDIHIGENAPQLVQDGGAFANLNDQWVVVGYDQAQQQGVAHDAAQLRELQAVLDEFAPAVPRAVAQEVALNNLLQDVADVTRERPAEAQQPVPWYRQLARLRY